MQGISASGLSLYSHNDISAVRNKMQDLKTSLQKSPLDSVTATKLDSLTSSLNSFLDLKAPTTQNFGEISQKIMDFMDHISVIDEAFIQDILEMAQDDKKRTKGKMATDYFLDRLAQISPANAALASSASVSSTARSSSSSLDFNSSRESTVGDLYALVDEEDALAGDMGEITALGSAARADRASRFGR